MFLSTGSVKNSDQDEGPVLSRTTTKSSSSDILPERNHIFSLGDLKILIFSLILSFLQFKFIFELERDLVDWEFLLGLFGSIGFILLGSFIDVHRQTTDQIHPKETMKDK